jgi:co-chaperonin GroES (HSP10)
MKVGEQCMTNIPPIPPLEHYAPGLRPTGFNVLVGLPDKEAKIGSIFIPEHSADKEAMVQVRGRIVAISPAAFDFADFGANVPVAGDAIVFAKLAGVKVEGSDGREYRLLLDKDVSAVIEEAQHA